MVSNLDTGGDELRADLRKRVIGSVTCAVLLGLGALALSPAGGPTAALLDAALLAVALWLGRRQIEARDSERNPSAMSANQTLLLLLALGGAAVLIATGASSRPLHGLAVAPFGMAAFAVSSGNGRDLRSAVMAASASLGILSVADDRPGVVVACATGLLLLVFGWMAARELMTLELGGDRYRITAPATRPWGTAVALRVALLAALTALLVPAQPRPHGRHAGTGAAFPGDRGYAIAAADGAMDLRQRGSLDDQPVIDVPADTPTLWQGGYLETYAGTGWTRALTSGHGSFAHPPLPAVSSLVRGPGLTQSEVRLRKPLYLVFSPGPVVGLGGSEGSWFDFGNGSLGIAGRTAYLAPYTVDWSSPGSAPIGLLAASQPLVSDARWLQLPAELPQRVRDLAGTVTAAAPTMDAKVSAVEDYLRTHEKYQLDSPVPADGHDAVDAFLFVDHVGFCEQFASAETVMLRSLGIPARVATGFGGPGAVGIDGRRVYRNEDAHAWVQVGYPGERWVASDPTAGSQLATAKPHGSALDALSRLWRWLTGTVAARRWFALGLAVISLLVWRLWLLLGSRRTVTPQPRRSPATSEAGRAYERLLSRLAEQGRPRRENETLRDVLLRLRAPDLEAVARVLESEWYGGAVPATASQVAAAVALLDGLATEALIGLSP